MLWTLSRSPQVGFDGDAGAPETHGHTKRLLSQWLANFKNGIHRAQRATFRYVFDGKEFRVKKGQHPIQQECGSQYIIQLLLWKLRRGLNRKRAG